MDTKKLVITDLDNTLYCWEHFFANSHRKVMEFLSELLDLSVEHLCENYKTVSQAFDDIEYPLNFETMSLIPNHLHTKSGSFMTSLQITSICQMIFDNNRKNHLKLYPTVLSTLKELKENNIPIVALTNASGYNVHQRLKALHIEDYFTEIYAVNNSGVAYEMLNKTLPAHYTILEKGVKKPSPQTLLHICAKYNTKPEDAIFIGDSLTKDMKCTVGTGVRSVLAKYGTKRSQELWDYLKNITAWTPDKVAKEEAERHESLTIIPDLTVNSFDEILPFIGLYK